MDVIELLKDYGLAVTLTVFFVVQSAIREKRMGERITAIEDYVRLELKTIIEESRQVISANTAALRDFVDNFKKD